MITEPTVLIFGAGISQPFDFPSGMGLAHVLCENLKRNNTMTQKLVDMGYDAPMIREFRDAFHQSGRESVDAFLETRPNFIPVGKAAIAYALIQWERLHNLFQIFVGNLYMYLFRHLCGSDTLEDFSRNKLSVITYNYDRSFEHYIFTALRYSFGVAEDKAAELMRCLPVVHLHGQLGGLPWQRCKPEQIRDYSPELTERSIRVASDGIKIIHEADDLNDAEFLKAHKLLSRAKEIVFLGFGYHRTNLERLRLDNLRDAQILRGTCYGFTLKEIELLRLDLLQKFFVKAKVGFSRHVRTFNAAGLEEDLNSKALKYLREYVTLQ